jgi:type IV secretory pathway TraG/TraD family ATPase VirD4
VFVLYDEFGHSTIPSFVSVANTIRGYRVSLSIVLQSLAQLSARYGNDYARSIQGGFNTYLAYSGSDPETARFFQEVAGKVIEVSRNKLEELKEQRQEYNLLNADAVRRIEDHQAVLVSANKNPAIIETLPYFQHGRYGKVPKRFGMAHISGKTQAVQTVRVPL